MYCLCRRRIYSAVVCDLVGYQLLTAVWYSTYYGARYMAEAMMNDG
jgi:hypothetical protein